MRSYTPAFCNILYSIGVHSTTYMRTYSIILDKRGIMYIHVKITLTTLFYFGYVLNSVIDTKGEESVRLQREPPINTNKRHVYRYNRVQ